MPCPLTRVFRKVATGRPFTAGARAVSAAIADLCLIRLYMSARKLPFISRWDYFRTPQDALNTACSFATWAHLEGDLIQHRVTELFIEVTVHDSQSYFPFITEFHTAVKTASPVGTLIPARVKHLPHPRFDLVPISVANNN